MLTTHRNHFNKQAWYKQSAFAANIFIEVGNPARPSFFHEVETNLAMIKAYPAGQGLLGSITENSSDGRNVYICLAPDGKSRVYPVMTDAQQNNYPLLKSTLARHAMAATYASQAKSHGMTGSSAEIVFDPTTTLRIDPKGYPSKAASPDANFISLGHELKHVSHVLKGDSKLLWTDAFGVPSRQSYEEELRTIGLGPWSSEEGTENKLRAEHGLPLRKHYFGSSSGEEAAHRAMGLDHPLESDASHKSFQADDNRTGTGGDATHRGATGGTGHAKPGGIPLDSAVPLSSLFSDPEHQRALRQIEDEAEAYERDAGLGDHAGVSDLEADPRRWLTDGSKSQLGSRLDDADDLDPVYTGPHADNTPHAPSHTPAYRFPAGETKPLPGWQDVIHELDNERSGPNPFPARGGTSSLGDRLAGIDLGGGGDEIHQAGGIQFPDAPGPRYEVPLPPEDGPVSFGVDRPDVGSHAPGLFGEGI